MLTLAYFNRFVFSAEVAERCLEGNARDNLASAVAYAFELALGSLVVFVAAAILGITPPPQ